jgi:hypothetical protein
MSTTAAEKSVEIPRHSSALDQTLDKPRVRCDYWSNSFLPSRRKAETSCNSSSRVPTTAMPLAAVAHAFTARVLPRVSPRQRASEAVGDAPSTSRRPSLRFDSVKFHRRWRSTTAKAGASSPTSSSPTEREIFADAEDAVIRLATTLNAYEHVAFTSRSTNMGTYVYEQLSQIPEQVREGLSNVPRSASPIGPITKTVYSYYGVQYFQSLILVTLTGVLWYLTQYRVNLPPGHTPVPCPIPEHTSRPTDTFFSVSQYRGLLIDELTDRGLTNCWFISGLLYKIKLAERETSGPMDISNDLEAYQERMDLLCEMIEDGDVDGDGKYFPFNTFRRLIAQTRLTFLFTISGVGADDDEDAYEIDDGVTVSRRQKKRVAACAAKAGVQVFEGRASGVPGGPFVDRFQKVLYPAPLDKTGGAWHGRVVLKKPKLVEKVRPRVSQIKRRRLFDGCPPVATVQHIRHNLDCSARLC